MTPSDMTPDTSPRFPDAGDSAAAGREIARLLGLRPLPDEGGLFRQTHDDGASTSIYYLLISPDFSALHRLAAAETYHYYAGAPLRLTVIGPDGVIESPVLGPDIAAGQRPQVRVPARAWQGSRSTGAWSLVGTTMCPGFRWDEFRLGDRRSLVARYPDAATLITALTRPHPAD